MRSPQRIKSLQRIIKSLQRIKSPQRVKSPQRIKSLQEIESNAPPRPGRRFPIGLRPALWVLAATSVSPALNAAESVEDLFHHQWYNIEFFVFERSEVMEYNTRETLVRRDPRRFPADLFAMPDQAGAWQGNYRLDPSTRLCLTFPTLTYTTSPDPQLTLDAALQFLPRPPPGSTPFATAGAIPAQGAAGLHGEFPGTTVPAVDPWLIINPPVIEPRLEPHPLLDLLTAVASFEDTLLDDSNRWQNRTQLLLRREARLVERRGVGRVLFHGRWLQAVPPREKPDHLLLQTGARIGEHWELEGTVAVTLGRYLHFQTEFAYRAPALGALPVEILLHGDGAFAVADKEPSADREPSADGEPSADKEPGGSGYMLMAESRRMRSAEIHYLDHPKLGVVVRIDPVPIPDALTAAFDALELLEEAEE